MLLAEGSKHCCQAAWANATEQRSHGWASRAWRYLRQQPWLLVGLGLPTVPQSLVDAIYCASMSGRWGAVAMLCSPVPAD